jgi:hypothetical protein
VLRWIRPWLSRRWEAAASRRSDRGADLGLCAITEVLRTNEITATAKTFMQVQIG